MVKELTRQDVIILIEELVQEEGSQAAAAKRIGITPSYVGDVLRGTREPGPAILSFFGIEKETVYRKK